MSQLEYNLRTILKYGVYLVLFTPLIYTSFTLFPFIFGKTLFFRTLIEILFAFYLILIVAFPSYRPKRSQLLTAILVYTGVLILATLFSVDAARSFWSDSERMMGLWTFLHVIALFLIITSIFKTKKDWKGFFGVSVWVSLLVGGLGVYQYFSDGFLISSAGEKIYSTLGNSIYFGCYGLFHSFIAAIFFLRERKKISLPGLFWFTGIAVGLVSIYLSGARGVLLGLCAAIFITLFLHALFYPSRKTRIVVGSILLLIVLGGGGLWAASRFLIIGENEETILDISFKAITAQTRLINWGVAFESWKQRPILGWGPDNYYIAFNKNYNPKMFEFGIYETRQDHAHNIVLDTLNESGILGLVSYFSIFLFTFYMILRSVRRKILDFTSGVLLFSLLSAYFVQNLFVFDTMTPMMLFYITLGFVYFLDTKKEGGASNEHKKSDFIKKTDLVYRYVLVGLLFICTFFLVYTTGITQLRASWLTVRGLKGIAEEFEGPMEMIMRASSLKSPYLQRTRSEGAKIIVSVVQAGAEIPRQKKEELLTWAQESIEKNIMEHPLDAYSLAHLGRWYFTMAQILKDESYFEKSKEVLVRAIGLAPLRQDFHFMAAEYHVFRKEYDEALKLLKKSVEFAPKVVESHWNLGLVYVYTNDLEAAHTELEFARKKGDFGMLITSKNKLMLALRAYTKMNDPAGLEWLYRNLNNMRPTPTDYARFANSYKKLGDLEKMEEMRTAALELDPGAEKRIDNIINED